MDDQQLLRYSRQIMLPQVDIEGQTRLLGASALVVGVGGLGSPVALYLAAAGVGRLVLADFDRVELSNLQRQIIHHTADIGRPKVASARERVAALNPEIQVELIDRPLDEDNLLAAVESVDLVLDGCDNFRTRFAVNAACVKARKPLVSGSVIRLEGQVAVFRADLPDAPCYRCLYPGGEDEAETCSETGVLAPLPGVIGSLQALEAVKLLAGVDDGLSSRLLVFDALKTEWRRLRLNRDPDCPVCGSR